MVYGTRFPMGFLHEYNNLKIKNRSTKNNSKISKVIYFYIYFLNNSLLLIFLKKINISHSLFLVFHPSNLLKILGFLLD